MANNKPEIIDTTRTMKQLKPGPVAEKPAQDLTHFDPLVEKKEKVK